MDVIRGTLAGDQPHPLGEALRQFPVALGDPLLEPQSFGFEAIIALGPLESFGRVNPDSGIGLELVRETDFIQSLGGAGGFLGTAAKTRTEVAGDTTTTYIDTPKGQLRSVVRRTAITSAQVEFPCKTADDIEKLLSVPYRWLFPSIVLFCAIGVYSTNNSLFDIWVVGIFGVVGYVFHKLGAEPAPLLLGLILGPMMEENLRRAYGGYGPFIKNAGCEATE